MKRPRKRLRRAIAVASTSLLVLTVVAWVWSEMRVIVMGLPTVGRHSTFVALGRGHMETEVSSRAVQPTKPVTGMLCGWGFEVRPRSTHGDRALLPRYLLSQNNWGTKFRVMTTGLCLPMIVLCAMTWLNWRWFVPTRRGGCPKCDYDLCGQPSSSATCPACGVTLPPTRHAEPAQ